MSNSLENKLVVLIGGNGFLGTHVAQDLLDRGARLRIVARNPESARKLKPLANLGQLQLARCNVKNADSIRACVKDADAVVYLVGTFGSDQKELHAEGARIAAEAAKAEGAEAFVYVSSLAADAEAEGTYASTKGIGEAMVLEAFPKATIMRPSVIFGQDDAFINMFAGLVASLPALPVFGPDAKLQPVWVDDVAEAVGVALADPATHGGKTYELAGPDVITMEQLHEDIAAAQGRKRGFIPVPDALSGIFAALPGTPMTSDQWRMLKTGSTASGTLPGIEKLGVTPKPLSLFLDKWMVRYRRHGRFTVEKA
ncbi:complex I NDUFA9 subunit family protein [Alteraurantiacibacter aquimixticola]|uniref:Complex I NDUFA9 subunit family protein n=1 Tax=Alteraurantiacibacter aquimixticola TaxID=2489173 RepID=A0A4T3EW60_9SPHN|nr:complex I NDUFA9 subunit family protein [Alteraurantiacibacter aquimixticola]TIX48785.1 complex I NDUFA9 subunit family protein [Alteraurantiacibacter aquimixticola]